MPASSEKLRVDFDRLAPLIDDGWDNNVHYHQWLLRRLPTRFRSALDVGCGTGAFSRLLAPRADRVLGIDLSQEMIRIARARSTSQSNVEYRVADLMTESLPPASFDCIVSLAALHHVPLAAALERLSEALAPGGILLVLDLYQLQGLHDSLWGAAAMPVNAACRLAFRGTLWDSREAREAWAEHCRGDTYPRLVEVRDVASQALPGARVRRHLFWRYSLRWYKPKTRAR